MASQVTVKRGGQAQRRGVARGGHLEVAGVVVGSWSPNFGGPRGRGLSHGAGADPSGRGRGAPHSSSRGGGGGGGAGPVSYSTRGGRAARGRRGAFQQGTNRKVVAANHFKGGRTNNEAADGQ